MLNLHGAIKAVTRFKVGFGMVELDEPYQGLKFASINTSTLGRFTLKRDNEGNLIDGTRVVIVDAKIGSEALLVLKIEKE
jgi:hypothetical protein